MVNNNMSVTHKEFLTSAEAMGRGTGEIDLRNAASRAYYSAYHACQNVVNFCPNVNVSDAGQHEKLILRFKRYPSTDPRHPLANKIANLLDQAKSLRVRADYKISLPFRRNATETQVHNVRRLLGLAQDFGNAHAAPPSP